MIADVAFAHHEIVEEIPIARIHKGEQVTSELLVGYTPPGDGPALLSIAEGWLVTKNRFKSFASYELVEERTDDGRQFRLVRDPATVERERLKDPTAASCYYVTVPTVGKVECDCHGRYATETRSLICKHAATLAHLLDIMVL